MAVLGDGSANLIGGATQLAATGGTSPFAYGQLGLGALETIGGILGLNKTPSYQSEPIDPQVKEMVNRAQAMAKQGYSPQEITNFYNQQAQQNAAKYAHGTEAAGGNLAGAVNAGINAGNSAALNQFAANDAKLKQVHQQYADQTLKYLQSLEDKSWMNDNAHLTALNSAFGGALKSGLSQLSGGLAGMKLPSSSPSYGGGAGDGAGAGGGGGASFDTSGLGQTDLYNPNIQPV